MNDIDSRVQAEVILTVSPWFQQRKGFLHAQNRGGIHDVTAEVTIVEDPLTNHDLYNTFLHQALGFWFGIEGYNFDLTLFSSLLYRLTGRRPIIRIEGDKASQV